MMAEMEAQGREVEVKLRFDTAAVARERLEALGAQLLRERCHERNVLYERDADPLKPLGKMLRLRRAGERAVLTYKSHVPGEHRHKVRIEEEIEVTDADSTERLLDGLGFRPAWRYEKYRTEFVLDELHISLDETPLGCFVELEGEPDMIDRVAARLGYREEQYVRDSYRRLHERAEGVRGRRVGDLVFEPRNSE